LADPNELVAFDSLQDGTLLVGRSDPSSIFSNLFLLRPGRDSSWQRWLPAIARHGAGQFSPNAKWVAYDSNESGISEIYVRRFPDADGRRQISTGGGRMPRWAPDGKRLFYLQGQDLIEVELVVADTITPSVSRRFKVGETAGYAVLPDGNGVVLCLPVGVAPPPTISVFLNWVATIKAK
jgi:hypothetical protein